MGQNTAIRITGASWDFLEPAIRPNEAALMHGKLTLPSGGTYVLYPAGQVVRQKNDGSNEWAKYGTSGFAGPARIIKYSILVNDTGAYQYSTSTSWDSNKPIMQTGSVEMYYRGYFKTQDLISAGGTNEVQTLTINASVDGGTYTLSWRGRTTAPIAWDANAATIKAAILLAMPEFVTGDLTVGGTTTFTFTGNYAGSNQPLFTVDPSLLTDGGIALTTGTAIVETTPGAGLLTGVGSLMNGTATAGIMQLGVGAPA